MEEIPKKESPVTPMSEGKPEKLDLPVRISNIGGRYLLSFSSQKAAEKFVVAFWKQVDVVRRTPALDSISSRFESGMWHPSQQLDSSCRTGMIAATNEEQKKDGVTTIVYINGNTGALQPWGVDALKKLVSI
ncbi:MAG TPA: hypothetical protein VK675_04540 [Candidatus Paceibacterota bacterium]|nr:hypothetical protein [Candidatus Paceibacterota bacterium]